MAWGEDLYWALRRRRRNLMMTRKNFPSIFEGHALRWYVNRTNDLRDYAQVSCYFGPGPHEVWLSYSHGVSEDVPNWTFMWGRNEYDGPQAPLDAIADFLSSSDLDIFHAYLRADELCTMVKAAYYDKSYEPGRVSSHA